MLMSDHAIELDDAEPVTAESGGCLVWPAGWWREGLIRPDRYVAMRELLCPLCGKGRACGGRLRPRPWGGAW